jgi:hypothetical protein
MIKLRTPTSSGSTTHYVAPENICRITEAGASSQWHGIRSIVRLFDGTTLECSEDVEAIYAAVEKVRGEA